MCILTFKNAIRLHEDSIILYKEKRYPSAYAISILALEEIGKYQILADFLWHIYVDGRGAKRNETDEIKSLLTIYDHKHKQKIFAREISYHSPKFPASFSRDIQNDRLDILKQNSIYVGLSKTKKEIDIKGKIISPMNISQKQARKRITTINDYFLYLAALILSDGYSMDFDEIEQLLDRNSIIKFQNLWPQMTPSIGKRFNKIIDQFDNKFR